MKPRLEGPPVAQASKPAVSQVSKPANAGTRRTLHHSLKRELPTGKEAAN